MRVVSETVRLEELAAAESSEGESSSLGALAQVLGTSVGSRRPPVS